MYAIGVHGEIKKFIKVGFRPCINNFQVKEKGGLGMGEISPEGRNDNGDG